LEHMAFAGTTTIGTTDWPREKLALDKVDEASLALEKIQKLARTNRAPQADVIAARRRLDSAREEARAFVRHDELSTILHQNGGRNLNASTTTDAVVFHVELPSNRIGLWFALESERLRDPVVREFEEAKTTILEERRRSVAAGPFAAVHEKL